MQYEPPRAFVRDLQRFDPELGCIWDRRRNCFAVVRWRSVQGRRCYSTVVLSRNPDPPHQRRVPGGWLINWLRANDTRRFFRSLRHFQREEGPQRRKNIDDQEKKDDYQMIEDVVHDSQDILAGRSSIDLGSAVPMCHASPEREKR